MTTTKQQKVRIGLFALVTGMLLGIVLVVFAGVHFWRDRDHYYVEFDSSVYGLENGADVYLNGIRVGKVTGIGIARRDIGKVQITLALDEGTPVRADTTAVLQAAGLTGLKVIDLRGGSLAAPKLAIGSTIPVGESLLDKLEQRGLAMVEQSESLLEHANRIFAKVDTVIGHLAEVSDPKQLGEIVIQTRTTAANLAEASAALRALVEENREGLRASITAIEATAKRASTLVDADQVKAAISDLRQASRSFKDLAREVRQRPSRLLYSSPEPDRKLP
jgi:ABC-type transporter Mla subunit MlaD